MSAISPSHSTAVVTIPAAEVEAVTKAGRFSKMKGSDTTALKIIGIVCSIFLAPVTLGLSLLVIPFIFLISDRKVKMHRSHPNLSPTVQVIHTPPPPIRQRQVHVVPAPVFDPPVSVFTPMSAVNRAFSAIPTHNVTYTTNNHVIPNQQCY